MRRLEPSQPDKARGSGGPRSEKGKRRSAQNALKHGLAVPVSRDPNLTPEVVRLARKICGQRDDLLDTAIEVAEAQIDLARVRRLRTERINGALQEPLRKSGTELRREIAFLGRLLRATKTGRLSSADQVRLREMKAPRIESAPERHARVLSALARELTVLDRYERRALSRRKTAIRRLEGATNSFTSWFLSGE